jgi:hypothetical protein
MLGDYLRAAAGFAPTAAILAAAPVGTVGAVVLGGFALLFSVFGIRTALRHGTRLEMDEDALQASGLLGGTIAWQSLDDMRLAYYSTRRDRRDGWMQLELRGGGSVLRLDSRLEGFNAVVERAADAAEARGLRLSGATVANLESLGIRSRSASLRDWQIERGAR